MNYKYLLPFFALLLSLQTKATNYTTVATGNFANTATWLGGIVPLPGINAADTITISAGTQVTLDQNIILDHPDAALIINGTLTSHTSSRYIVVKKASLYGSGNISSIDSLYFNSSKSLNMTGSTAWSFNKIHADTLYLSGGNKLIANTSLHVYGPLVSGGATTLEINQASSTIYMHGGYLSEGATGIINVAGCGDLIYMPGAANTQTGIELNGPLNITVDVQSSNNVELTSNLTVGQGKLHLKSGLLKLNSYDLQLTNTGDLEVTAGRIHTTSTSDISITTSNSLTDALAFATGGNTVKDMTIDMTNSSNMVKLSSTLLLSGTLDLSSGKLDVNASDLILLAGGTITNAGPFSYVIAEGTGTLVQDIGNNQSKTYPVGTINDYTPAIITSQNGAVHNGVKMNVLTGVRNFGNSGSYLSATQPCVSHTWHIQNTLSSGTDIQLELIWPTNVEANGFDRTKAYISSLVGNYWDTDATTAATNKFANSYYVQRKDIKKDGYFSVFDANTVSIENITQQAAVTLYPNPAKDVLRIEGITDGTKARIYNTTGQVISEQKLLKNSINTTMLPTGTYFLMLINNNTYIHTQFVKH